jgi:hypothetical protein
MDSHTSHEIDCAAYAAFKKSRKEHLKIDFPNLKEQDMEKRLAGEWFDMTEKEKMPFIRIVEENPLILERTCEGSTAHKSLS